MGSMSAVLRHRDLHRIADLLARSAGAVIEDEDDWDVFLRLEFTAPIDVYEQLKALSRKDRDAVLEAYNECYPDGPRAAQVRPRLDTASLHTTRSTPEPVLRQIESLRKLMTAVATGGPRIQDVEEQYIAQKQELREALSDLGIEDANSFDSLWDWYKKWSADLPTYQSRREYLLDLYKPITAQLRERERAAGRVLFAAATGWPAVDQAQAELRQQLERAGSPQQFQSVGLHCRELLITLAQTVFDATRHRPVDGLEPSMTDAKRMLDAYISAELAGSSNEELRKHARASFDLANALQHRRTATFRDAALCAEATNSIINLISIVSGRRDRNAQSPAAQLPRAARTSQ